MHPALALLERQRAAWNRGDLDGYLAECAEDVVYVAASGVVVGRDALRARFAAAYPDRTAMGELTLDVLRLDEGGAEARVVARWTVAGAAPAGGFALLVIREEGGSWRMTHDATIRVPTDGNPGTAARSNPA